MIRYEEDTYAWSLENASALREKRFADVDWDNVAEEILSVGRQERQTLRNTLVQVIVHLLKIRYQPGKHGRSWDLSVEEHRSRVKLILKDSPSLKPVVADILSEAYQLARFKAARQTRLPLSAFPEECEWTLEQVLGSAA